LGSCVNKNILAVISGDFNLDLSVTGRSSSLLTNLMSSYGLRDTIFTFTREYGGSSSLIDNIFTNVSTDRFKSSVLITGISDHHAQVADIRVGAFKTKSPAFKFGRSFSEDSIRVFRFLLKKESWDKLLSSEGIEKKFEYFMCVIKYNYDVAFPERKMNIKAKKASAKVKLDPETLDMRERMFHLSIQTKDLESSHPLKQNYIQIKKSFRERVRSEKANDVLRRVSNSKNQQKAMWDVVNENIPGKSAKPFTPLSIINDGGELLHDPKLVSDRLNEYFIQVGQAGSNSNSSTSFPENLVLARNFYLFPTDEKEVINMWFGL
jgi:hypothetical protein